MSYGSRLTKNLNSAKFARHVNLEALVKLVFKNGHGLTQSMLQDAVAVFDRLGRVTLTTADGHEVYFIHKGTKIKRLPVGSDQITPDQAEAILIFGLSFLGQEFIPIVETTGPNKKIRIRITTAKKKLPTRKECYQQALNHLVRVYKDGDTVSLHNIRDSLIENNIIEFYQWDGYVRKHLQLDGVLVSINNSRSNTDRYIYTDRAKQLLIGYKFR